MDQCPQNKTRYFDTTKRKIASALEIIGIGGDFLNRALIAQGVRPKMYEWDLLSLNISVCQSKPSFT